MPNIDLDQEFIELFYNITNSKAPANLTLLDLKRQLISIVDLLKDLNANSKKPIVSKALGNEEDDIPTGPSILIVDDLGVITYQLKVLLSRFDCDIDCSQEIYDAVNKFKKRKYTYVIMDLFIPTEREGFILLTELRKMALASDSKTIIGIMTASPRKEIEQLCKTKGADFFIEKSNDWQNSLLEIMNEYFSDGKEEEDDF